MIFECGHDQDWLLILIALDHYAREGDITEGQELRAYQLVESIASFHGTASLGAIQCLDPEDCSTLDRVRFQNTREKV